MSDIGPKALRYFNVLARLPISDGPEGDRQREAFRELRLLFRQQWTRIDELEDKLMELEDAHECARAATSHAQAQPARR